MSVLNTFAEKEAIRAAFSRKEKVFFVGIGGIQMHALAILLSRMGYAVGGSDRIESEATGRLRAAGIPVQIGHREENIAGYGTLIYTLAVEDDTPELRAARRAGIPCFSRADLLGYLMSLYPTRIAVAGMHGKSTTTAMLAAILQKADKDPTVISGAALNTDGEVFRVGGREIMLVEACEYKDSFLCLDPTVAVVLNAELEHTDYFHSEAEVCRSFSAFLARARVAILPAERQSVALLPNPNSAVVRFGQEEGAAVRALNVTYINGCPAFDVVLRGVIRGRIHLAVPGEHNLQNALAACAAADACGIPFATMRAALADFAGTPRRLQQRGNRQGYVIYEDYAHHPTEIRASLAALRRILPKNKGEKPRLICLYQPHTYSRTAAFFCDFADALSAADHVILLDIYAAREQNESGVSSAALAAAIPGAVYASDMPTALALLRDLCRTGDTLAVMGAGDIHDRFPFDQIETEM